MTDGRDGRFGCRGYRDKVGVLLAQLGTPDAPTEDALRRYLKEFLWDPRVIEGNRAVWWTVLNGIILRTRPKRSAALYKRIWTEKGSPLLLTTEEQTRLLSERIRSRRPEVEVAFGMRYGSSSIRSAVDALIDKGCKKLLLFPMYPQYSATTSASTYDAAFSALLDRRWVPTLRVAEPYFMHAAYIDALAVTMNEALERMDPKPSHLVLSYHGIPEKYVEKGDPYCCMCTETTRALLPKLSFPPEKVLHTYQSRFGKDPWLVPYTDETIERLAKEGAKRIAVAAPGFTADCLETLDELGNEGSHLFKERGGEELLLIPCLNAHPKWIEGLERLVEAELGSWIGERPEVLCPSTGVACPVRTCKGEPPVFTEER